MGQSEPELTLLHVVHPPNPLSTPSIDPSESESDLSRAFSDRRDLFDSPIVQENCCLSRVHTQYMQHKILLINCWGLFRYEFFSGKKFFKVAGITDCCIPPFHQTLDVVLDLTLGYR